MFGRRHVGPPVRIILAVIAVQAGLFGAGALTGAIRTAIGIPPGPAAPIDLLLVPITLAGLFGAYLLYVRLVERRAPTEVGLRGAGRELALGAAIGAGLMSLCVGMLWIAGGYAVTGLNSPMVLPGAAATALFRGFSEELLMRGIGLRIGVAWLGRRPALIISAAIFGLLHARNPGADAWSSLAIALEAGILLGAAYVYTGRLWMAAGLHAAWNFTQGGLFGLPVSGTPTTGLVQSVVDGPWLVSGGGFGIEAAPTAVALCLLTALLLLRKAGNAELERRAVPQAEPGG